MNEFKMGYNKFYLGDDENRPLAEITWTKPNNKEYIIIDHTYVHPTLRGQNIATRLVKRVVEYARDNDIKVASNCSFASAQLAQNEEYYDVAY